MEQDGEEVSVNKEPIRNGHVWWFWHYDKDEANGMLEFETKKEERGLFASETPIYPRNWRRGARIVGSGGGGNSGFASTVFIMAILPDPSGLDANNETVILARRRQHRPVETYGRRRRRDAALGRRASRWRPTVWVTSSLQLGNIGDAVSLRNSQGETVQTVQSLVGEPGVLRFGLTVAAKVREELDTGVCAGIEEVWLLVLAQPPIEPPQQPGAVLAEPRP